MSAATSEVVVVVEIAKSDALAPAFVGLEVSSARQLREAFVPALLQIEEWERQAAGLTVTDESETAKMQLAGVMRKALKKVRVGVEKKRKELGADALARTKAINHAAGIVEGLIVPLEKRLLESETFGERAATARQNALQSARADALRAYGADPSLYASLGELSDEAWAALLDSARVVHEAKIEEAKRVEAVRIEAARLEAEARAAAKAAAIKAEAERVERERLQLEENARLQREKAELEAVHRLEREAAERAAAEMASAAKVERDRVEAERAAERAQAAAEAEAAERGRAAIEATARAEREVEKAKAADAVRAAQEATDRAARELASVMAAAAQAKADAEAATAERVAADAARAAAEADAKKPTKLKYSLLARALESIAQWGEDLASADEPHAAARAREALSAVGLGR